MLFDDIALKLVEISLELEMLRAIKMFLTIKLKNVSSKCLSQPNTNIFVIVEKKKTTRQLPLLVSAQTKRSILHEPTEKQCAVYASDQMGFSCHHNIMY